VSFKANPFLRHLRFRHKINYHYFSRTSLCLRTCHVSQHTAVTAVRALTDQFVLRNGTAECETRAVF